MIRVADKDLHPAQDHLDLVQGLAKIGYWEWDFINNLVSASETAFLVLGIPYQAQIELDKLIANVVPDDMGRLQLAFSSAIKDKAKIEISFRVADKNNSIRYLECMGKARYNSDGEVEFICGTIQDITRFHRAESTVEYQLNYDVLTGIPNRQFFQSELAKHCANLRKEQCSTVIVFDIDNFKDINYGFGQDVGDQLLILLAERLKKVTRKGDFVARLGSDEFAVIVKTCKSSEELHLLINRLEKDLKQSFLVKENELFLTFSFGVATYPYDTSEADSLMHKANIARGKAKRAGGNQAVFYQSKMNLEAKNRFRLENDLHRSIEQEQIKVFFQPQVDAKTLKPIGAEALVRWKHPTAGWISPEVFVPLAESAGLISDIGMFVLKEAICELKKWQQLGYEDLSVGVNLSPAQLVQTGLVESVKKYIEDAEINPACLALEITESLAMSDAQEIKKLLVSLKSLGVSLAIDDFGTGYSSLSYLHDFPIDTLKIDQSFIANLHSSAGETLVLTILAMAKGLGLNTVAEGIENPTQIEFLQQANCDILQGFFFGEPMESSEFIKYLLTNK